MGCPNLIIVADHQPLPRVFMHRDLRKIYNHCLLKKNHSDISLPSRIARLNYAISLLSSCYGGSLSLPISPHTLPSKMFNSQTI